MINSVFVGNFAQSYGGALFSSDHSTVIRNCTFHRNVTNGSGNAIYSFNQASLDAKNTIFWGTSGDVQIVNLASASITYCTIIGSNFGDQSNLTLDPNFKVPAFGDGTNSVSQAFYDEISLHTSLSFGLGNWLGGQLIGSFIQPNTDDPRWFLIMGNTASSIQVWGDLSGVTQPGKTYRLFDPHLQFGSPCIGAADSASATLTDIDGNSRSDPDMGAFEY